MSAADRQRSRKAANQRRWTRECRGRAKLKLKMLKPVVPYHPFIEACLDSEMLTEAEALDEKKVNEAASAVLGGVDATLV